MNKPLIKLRKYLIAGMIAILPFWVTYYVLFAVFNLAASLAKPFLKYIPPLASAPTLLNILSVLGTIIIVFGLGIVVTNVVGQRVFRMVETLFQRIPLLSWIYTSIRKLILIFYDHDDAEQKFKRVVLVEYPRKDCYVFGFVTSEVIPQINAAVKGDLVHVFIPTTPNPTSGFLLLVKKKEVINVDISTEEAIKLIVSFGIAAPERI